MAEIRRSFDPPYNDALVDREGFLSSTWTWFFRSFYDRLYPLGEERIFPLENNKLAPVDVIGLRFSPKGITAAFFEYLVQRVTTGAGAQELTEAGILIFVYNPTSQNWSRVTVSENLPDDSGINFSITASGQVQYTSSNVTGAPQISSLYYRCRTLAGKNSLYSIPGAR